MNRIWTETHLGLTPTSLWALGTGGLHSPDREDATSDLAWGEAPHGANGEGKPILARQFSVAKVELPFSGGGDSEQVDDGETNLQDLLIGVVFSAPANLQ
jgi:hypothetical protein